MNRIYRVIWSKVRNTWMVASEFATGHGKNGGAKRTISRPAVGNAVAVSVASRAWPLTVAVLAALLAMQSPARAADKYWDANQTKLGLGGTDTWDLTNSFWDSAGDGTSGPYVTWDNSAIDNAIFSGAAGTVTLGVPITAHNLTFNAAGYTLTGNTLTLAGTAPTITTAGTTTIDSVLAGSAGLTKAGGGNLLLNGANTFTGDINLDAGGLFAADDAALGAAGNTITTAAGQSVTLSIDGTVDTARTVTIGDAGTLVVARHAGSALLTGDGNVYVNASGTVLSNDANSYTGTTTFRGCNGVCSLYFTSIGNLGEASSLGAPTDATLGTISFNQSSQYSDSLIYIGDGDSSNRNWALNGAAAVIRNQGTGTLSLAGDISGNGGSQFRAEDADIELLGEISGTTDLVLGGNAGHTITVGGANSYTGVTAIQNITVVAPALADSGANSSFGTGPTIDLANATLSYTGAATASDRTWTGQGASAIRNDGTGSLALSGPFSFVAGGPADTLALGGSFGGTSTFSGAISGVGDLVADGSGTWVLDGANTYIGSVTVQSGTLEAGNAQAFGVLPATAIVNGGTLDLGGLDTTFTSLSGSGGSVALGSATLTLDNTSGSTGYAGDITGSGGLTKRGASIQTLSGANTYTGATTILGGTLGLDFAAAGGPVDNIISDLSTLTMAGGTLLATGAAGEANTQTFNGVDINGGNNNIGAVSGSGGSATLDLGAITRSSGLVDFDLPTAGFITTTNTALGGWATINNGSDYAKVDGGNIVALAPEDYTVQDNPSLWLDGQIITDDVAGFTTDPVGTLQLGGLRYTAPESTTLNIATGNTLGIDGNILVTPTVLDNDQAIDGGSLTGPVGGGVLGIQQNSTGDFAITSSIVDNGGAIGFVKGGTGEVTLYNVFNSYTGATIIAGGTLHVGVIGNGGAVSGIGASSADSSNLVLQSGILRYGGTTATTDRGFTLLNGGPARTIQIDSSTANLTFTGLVTSPDDAGLTKTGAGTLTLANAANDYIGVTTVAGGTLSVGTLADGAASSGIGAASSSSANLVLLNNGRLQYTGGTIGIDRGFTLESGNGWIDVAQAATTLTIDGNAVGTGKLVKGGAGTLVLTGTNAYTGDTVVAGGTLRAGSASAFGPPDNYMTVNGGATLELGGFDISAGALVGSGTVDLGANTFTSAHGPGTFAGTITGSGGFTRGAGSYTQVLSGCNNDYTGATTINSSLSVDCIADGGVASSIGASTSDSANLVFNNGTLSYTGSSVTTNRGFTLASGAGAINVSQADTTLEFSGQVVGGGTLNKVGAGTLVLSGNNTYTGSTYLNGGVLRAASDTAFGGSGAIRMDGLGTTLDLNGFDNTVSVLSEAGGVAGDTTRRVVLGGATLTLSGANGFYSGVITGAGNLVKTAGNTQTLAGCESDYTGTTTITGGAINVACLDDGGAASSIGNSSADAANLVLDGGILGYVGDGDSTDRMFTLGAGGGVLNALGTGTINFTNTAPIVLTGTTARTLTLRGTNTGNNTLSARIDDASGGATRVTKTDAGTWILANDANRYTGITTISGGVLGVSKLADGGQESSIGMSSNAASNLVIGNGSTLRYTGSGDTTDRLFTLGQGVTFIESAGSGAIQFTNTSAVTLGSASFARTIALGGTNTGDNTMGGAIADASAGAKTTLAKNGTGTWVLTGNNTYTGNTVINDGNLVIGNGGTTGNAGAGNVIVDSATSTLSINRSDAFDFTGTLSGPGSLAQIGTGVTRLTATGNDIGATSIDAGTLEVDGSLASATIALNGASTLDVHGAVEGSGGDAATLTGDAGASTIRIAAGGTLHAGGDLGAGNDRLDITGNLDTDTDGLGLGAGDDTVVLNDGAVVSGTGIDAGDATVADTLQINNAADLAFDGTGFAGFEQLSKHDAGVLTLTGAQTFAVGTEVTEGTLDVDGTLETAAITLADDTTLNVDGTVQGTGGAPATITGSAGANTIAVNAGATLVAGGDLGGGDDDVDVVGTLDTGVDGLALGAGDDTLTLHDGASLVGTGVDAGAGTGDQLVLDNAAALAFDGGMTAGFEALLKQNSGIATMTGSQSFAGTTINGGTLAIDGTLATGSITMADATTLAVDGTVQAAGGTQTAIAGSAGANTVTVGSGGSLLASGDLGDGDDVVTLAGLLDTGSGTLGLGAGDDRVTLGDGAAIDGTGIDAGAGTNDQLILDNASDLDFDGTATSGFETLVKQNAGTASMSGTQAFSAGTALDGGTLAIDGTLQTPTLTMADGTTLDVGGTLEAVGGTQADIGGSAGANTVTVAAGGTLLATGDLGDGNDTLDVAGTLDTGSGTFSLGAGDDAFVIHDGTQVLGTVDGGAGLDTGIYDIDLTADIGALTGFEGLTKTGTGTLNINGPDVSDIAEVQVLEGTLDVGAAGAIAGVTDTTVASGATLNVDGSYAGSTGNDTFTVAGSVDGAGSIDLGDGDDVLTLQDGAVLGAAVDGGVGSGDEVVLDNATDFTLDGTSALGFEQLTKQNTGTATLTGTHAYDTTSLDGGTLAVAGTLATDSVAMADGTTLDIDGTVQGAGGTQTAITGTAGANTIVVATGGTLRATGDLGDGNDVFDLAGALDTGTGTFSLGAGDDTFVVHNTTSVTGTLDAGAGNDMLDVNVGTGSLVPLGSTTGFESLAKSGLGGLQINGASDFIDVQVHAGLLDVAATGSVAAHTVTIDAGATLNVDGTFDFTADADTFTVAGTVDGAGTIDMLDGDDTLTLLDGADLSGLASPIDGGAGNDALIADIATSATLGGAAGFETLTKDGAGTLHVDGPATSSFGSVDVLGGTLDVGAAASVDGVSATTVAAGATLNVDGSYAGSAGNDSFTLAGTVSGAGSIDLGDGDDVLTLQDGAVLGAAVAGGAGSGDEVVLDNAADFAFDGTSVSGFEQLTKQNTGTATLTGAHSYDGVAIDGGMLDVDQSLETGTVTLADGTTLNVDGTLQAAGGTQATVTGSAGVNTVVVGSGASVLATGDLGDGSDMLDVAGTLDTGSGTFSLGAGDDNLVIHDGTNIIGTIDGGAGIDSRIYDIAGTASIGALQGFEGLTKRNTGTLHLTGPAGSDLVDVAVEGGTLDIQDAASVTGARSTSVLAGATLNVDGSYAGSADADSFTVAGTVSGSGSIDLGDGDDTLTLQDGAVLDTAIDGGGATDSVVLDNAADLAFDGTNVTGFENLAKQNTGAATLTGSHAYDDTTVTGGTLEVDGTLQTATLGLADGTTLDVVGTVQAADAVPAVLSGDAGASTVRVGTGGSLAATGDLGAGDDALDIAGTLDTGTGTFSLGAGDDTFTVHDGTVINGIVAGGDGTDTSVYDIDLTADIGAFTGFEGLTKTGAGVLNIRGPAGSSVTDVKVLDGTLNVATDGSIANVTDATVASGATLVVDGGLGFTTGADILTIAGTVAGTGAIVMSYGDDQLILQDGADLSGLTKAINGGPGSDTLVADIATSATLGGATGFETLTKRNTGSLEVTGPAVAAFETVLVEGGLLDVTATGSLNAQHATVDTGATLNIDGSFSFTAGADTFDVAGTVTGSGPIDMLDGDDTLTLHDGADLASLATSIDGGAGTDSLVADIATSATLGGATAFETLVKQGAGQFTIAGPADSQFDTVLVHQGELEIAAGALVDPQTTVVDEGSIMTVDGTYHGTTGADTFTLSGTLAGDGDVDLLDGDDVLTINTGADVTFDGTFDASTQAGADRLVLAGDGEDSFDAGLVGTVFTNFEQFRKEGAGTWTLTGTGGNDWTVAAGTLVGDSSSFGGDIDNEATVVFDQAADGSYGHVVSGDGTLVKRNVGTLALTGTHTFSGDTRIEAGTLQVDGTLPGALAITSGATLSGIGTVGDVSAPAGSFVAPGNAAYPFNTLTVAGDFAGGGTVSINTVLGDEQSDTGRLLVHGDVSGTSAVLVNPWSGDGAMTKGDGIGIIQVDGKSAADSFRLAKSVQAGAYEYLLYQGGSKDDNDWYLRSELIDGSDPGDGEEPPPPAFRPGVPGYVLGHQANLEYGFTVLGDLRSRVGDQGRIPGNGQKHPTDFWARVYTHDLDIDGTRFSAHDLQMVATQFGADIHATASGDASTHFGLMASIGSSRATLSDNARGLAGLSTLAGRMETKTKGAGMYWTHFGPHGGYIDLAGQVLHYRNQYRDASLVAGHQSGWGGTASVEVGTSRAIGGGGWFVQPELQLAYQHLDLDGFVDNVSDVGDIDDNALRARAAVRLAHAPMQWLGMNNASPYVGFGAQRDYRDASNVTVGGTTLNDVIPDTTGDVSLGFTGDMVPGVELHFDMRYQKSTHGKRDGMRANLGIRVAF